MPWENEAGVEYERWSVYCVSNDSVDVDSVDVDSVDVDSVDVDSVYLFLRFENIARLSIVDNVNFFVYFNINSGWLQSVITHSTVRAKRSNDLQRVYQSNLSSITATTKMFCTQTKSFPLQMFRLESSAVKCRQSFNRNVVFKTN